MIYLLLGEDTQLKDQKIAEIKKKVLTSKEAHDFDYEVLHALKLDSATLKKTLIALPAVSKKRLIVIRTIQKLDAHNKELILDFIQKNNDYADLILDSDEADLKDSFITKISAKAQVLNFSKGSQQNVFDMTRAISTYNPTQALKILENLFMQGIHPLQIMGGVVWFWGKNRGRVSNDQFKKGLVLLQETDFNIKRSRLDPEQAIEVLVVKLCSLKAY